MPTEYEAALDGMKNRELPMTNISFYFRQFQVERDAATGSLYIQSMNLVNSMYNTLAVFSWQAVAYNTSGTRIGNVMTVRDNRGVWVGSNIVDLYVEAFGPSAPSADIAHILIEVNGFPITTKNTNNQTFMAFADINVQGVTFPYTVNLPRKGAPCFVRGAPILTPSGYRPVESIRTGDLVLTAEKRTVAVKAFQTTIETTTTSTAPYHIPAGTLGQPNDMYLSPMHAIQKVKGEWHIPFVLAKYIPAVKQYDVGKPVTYYHIECPNYLRDNLVYDGAVVESFGNKQAVNSAYEWNPKKMSFTRLNRICAPSKGSQ